MASSTPGFKSPVLIKCYKNWYVCVLFPNMMTTIFEMLTFLYTSMFLVIFLLICLTFIS